MRNWGNCLKVASHPAKSAEGRKKKRKKEKPLNRTCNGAISDPFLKLKLVVFDSIRDVLQKGKGGRKERKKKKQNPINHQPSLQTSVKSSVTCGMAKRYRWKLQSLGWSRGINGLAVRRWAGQVCRLTVSLTDSSSWGWAVASQEGKEYIRQTITLATGLQILRFKQERHYGTCKHLHLSLEREEVKLGVHLVIKRNWGWLVNLPRLWPWFPTITPAFAHVHEGGQTQTLVLN